MSENDGFLTAEIRTASGAVVGMLVLNAKTFSSGSTGYHGQGEIEIPGVGRFQCQCQAVLIGSKPKEDK